MKHKNFSEMRKELYELYKRRILPIKKECENTNQNEINEIKLWSFHENVYDEIINIFLTNTLRNSSSSKPLFSFNEYNYNISVDKNRSKEYNTSGIFNYAHKIDANNFIVGSYKNEKIKIFNLTSNPSFLESYSNFIITAIFTPFFIVITKTLYEKNLLFLSYSITGIILSLILFFLFSIIYYHLTFFRGIVIEVSFDKNLSNEEIIFHEESFLSTLIPFKRKRLKRVILESINFEKNFNVYSTDQTTSRYIFTPQYIEKIDTIRKVFNSRYIRGKFYKNKLILAINSESNILTIGNVFNADNLILFYKEMVSILKLIEYIAPKEKNKI